SGLSGGGGLGEQRDCGGSSAWVGEGLAGFKDPLVFYSSLSKGSQGRAYLFNSVVNVGCGPAEERVLLTGLHAVSDIHCESCKTTLGWKYEQAFESSQKYKEGKYIIELSHMIKDNGWD
ncbi:protein yippee-like 3, partial [Chrysemys picta bellii]|uniref:protein yippee-like 3 n=1 Tax=Chrysemys picta bellii TaxID=8478 RepID=UPI0032B167DA